MNNLVPLGAVVHDRADNLQLGLHSPWLPKPAAVQAVLYMYRNS